jgi:tellurite resistance protein TerC
MASGWNVVGETELWIIFAILFAAMMIFDFVVADRKPYHVTQKKAIRNVITYVCIAAVFGILVFLNLGHDAGTSFFAAYIIEFAMSVDNLFVFIIIFAAFSIRDEDEHKVLFYGILGAICFRALLVFIGAELLKTFDWMLIIFGAIILYAAYKTAFGNNDKPTEETFAYRIGKRIKSADEPSEGRFFVRVNGKRVATAMFVCLVVIELSDVMFAFDSIPAALSITTDVFIVFTSNILAVMGLRSLFFVLKNALNSLTYLNYGLGAILTFIGIKMFMSFMDYEIPVHFSVMVIIIILAITVAASLLAAKKKAARV